jgi:ABC-2 type transport system permease protein
MRALAYLHKTFLENLREWKILVLALLFAPAFVYMMYGYFAAATPAYHLLVLNLDAAGDGAADGGARGLIEAWTAALHPDGKPLFKIALVDDFAAAQTKVKNRDADLLVEIPAGFSRSLADFRARRTTAPARLTNHVEERNLRGSMAMALSDYVAFTYAIQAAEASVPLDVAVRPVGAGRPLSDFDLYVPALLVLALIMVLFTAATSLIKEVDKGTMTRLMLSKLKTGELLAAVAANQVLIGVAALALTYAAALSCGYRSPGSLTLVLLVGAVTTLSVVAIAVLTAAFLKSMFELLTVGTFPFFILMFFSECMFPLPKIPVLRIAAHTLYANDVLPTSLGVKAFNKVLNSGGGLGDIAFELGVILVLTALYFALGIVLFRRRHLRV